MKTLTFLFLTLFFNLSVASQTYNVTVIQSPYVALVDGQLLVEEAWREAVFSVPIGFDFTLFDEVIDSLYSQIFFAGGYLSSSLDYFSTNILMPISTDLVDRGIALDSSLSPILYKIEGEIGHRIFTLEFKDAGFSYGEVNNDIYTDFINIQLRLKEENGAIEVHIGPYSVQNPGLDFEGFTGPNIGLLQGLNFEEESISGEILILAGDPLNPDVITELSQDYLEWPIPENTLYIFSRIGTGNHTDYEVDTLKYYFPNPASNTIVLTQLDQEKIISPVHITNTLGYTVSKTDYVNVIDIRNLPSGIYTLHFETTSGFVTQRISIIK